MSVVMALQSIFSGEVLITERAVVLGHISQVLGFNMIGESGLIGRGKITLSTTVSSILITIYAPLYSLS